MTYLLIITFLSFLCMIGSFHYATTHSDDLGIVILYGLLFQLSTAAFIFGVVVSIVKIFASWVSPS